MIDSVIASSQFLNSEGGPGKLYLQPHLSHFKTSRRAGLPVLTSMSPLIVM